MDHLITEWQSGSLFELNPGQLVVVMLDQNSCDQTDEGDLRLLTIIEKERADRFHFSKDRNQFLTARIYLKRLIGQLLKVEPGTLELAKTTFGKLYLPDYPSLNFNLTHSTGVVLYAFALNQEVGVDVEAISRQVHAKELAQRFFAPQEVSRLMQLSGAELQRAFFRVWTRKEAFIKAEGSGLSFPLQDFSVPVEALQDRFGVEFNLLDRPVDSWLVETFIPKAGYLASVAAKRAWDETIFIKI